MDLLGPAERLVLGSAHVGPNSTTADDAGFSSAHPGGVNVLFFDGHVRFVSDSISVDVWKNLAHRSDGGLSSTQ